MALSLGVVSEAEQQSFPVGRYVYSNLCVGDGGIILGHRVTFEHQDNGNQVTLEVYGSTDLEIAAGLPVDFDPLSGRLEFRYFITDDDDYFRGEVTPESMAGVFTDTYVSELLPRVRHDAVPKACDKQSSH